MNASTSSNLDAADSQWQTTNFQHLIRYTPSGVYFARFKVGKRQFRFSLKTRVLSVAKLLLADKIKEKRAAVPAKNLGKMLVKDAMHIHCEQIKNNGRLKPRTKLYYEELLNALKVSWPNLAETEISRITSAQVREWAVKLSARFSPTRFNNTLATLRQLLQIGVREGARHNNPTADVHPSRSSAPLRDDLYRKRRGRSHGVALAWSQRWWCFGDENVWASSG
jgi:hypothetical protein